MYDNGKVNYNIMRTYESSKKLSKKRVDKTVEPASGLISTKPFDKHPLQKKESEETVYMKNDINKTGLSDSIKSGVEQLSGMDMGDVRVHYNSSKPASVHAHAYTQGTDIHIASGQEKYLGHEAWHVVQQKQGRVKPTMSICGVAVNDSPTLESEADSMGKKIARFK